MTESPVDGGARTSGEVLELGANRPLSIADPRRCWRVLSGIVEVFAVAPEGAPEAPRLHLATAVVGDAVFGIEDSPDGTRAIAVGAPGTTVEVVDDVDSTTRRAWLALLIDDLAPDSGVATAAGTDVELSAALAAALDDRKDRIRADDAARVRAQRRNHRDAFAVGIESLVELLVDDEIAARRHDDEDPLLAAFRLVAREQGVRAVTPPPGAGGEDPLMTIARASGVRIRPVTLTGEWWREDCGAMLGYLDDGHRPVALVPHGAARYRLIDPLDGARILVDARVAARLEPRAAAVYRPLPDGPLSIRDFVLSGLTEVRPDLVRLVLFALGAALLALAVPLVTGQIVGSVIPEANRPELLQLTIALLVAALATAMLQLATATAVLRVQGRLDRYLGPALWGRLLSLPTSFFRRYSAGDLAYRVLQVGAVVELVSGSAVASVLGGVFSIFSLGLIWFYSVQLGIVATLLLAALVATIVIISRIQLRRMQAVEDLSGVLSGMLREFVTAIGKLRVGGAQEQAFQRWATRFAAKRERWNAVRGIENVLAVVMAGFPVVASIALFAVVGLGQPDAIAPGAFLAVNAAFTGVVVAVSGLAGAIVQVNRAVPGLQRALPIITELPEEDVTKSDPGVLKGAVDFSSVSFRYQADGPLVLDDVTIRVPAGASIALVGPSGSGKSTLGRLLLGFEEPENGGVFFDNQDLSGLDVRAVRRQLGVVLQSVELLPGTIQTNIVGSAVDLTVEDAWRAAEEAGLADDIRAMPMGMSTAITEGGSTLSGGQKQRLLIAQALAGNPRIILFDEATSALDNTTQAIVADSLAALNATRIMIAHRLSTVVDADCIYYLERGRVVESGTYAELMAADGGFAAQARRQLS